MLLPTGLLLLATRRSRTAQGKATRQRAPRRCQMGVTSLSGPGSMQESSQLFGHPQLMADEMREVVVHDGPQLAAVCWLNGQGFAAAGFRRLPQCAHHRTTDA